MRGGEGGAGRGERGRGRGRRGLPSPERGRDTRRTQGTVSAADAPSLYCHAVLSYATIIAKVVPPLATYSGHDAMWGCATPNQGPHRAPLDPRLGQWRSQPKHRGWKPRLPLHCACSGLPARQRHAGCGPRCRPPRGPWALPILVAAPLPSPRPPWSLPRLPPGRRPPSGGPLPAPRCGPAAGPPPLPCRRCLPPPPWLRRPPRRLRWPLLLGGEGGWAGAPPPPPPPRRPPVGVAAAACPSPWATTLR